MVKQVLLSHLLVTSLLVGATSSLHTRRATGRSSSNLFEPLYNYDDADIIAAPRPQPTSGGSSSAFERQLRNLELSKSVASLSESSRPQQELVKLLPLISDNSSSSSQVSTSTVNRESVQVVPIQSSSPPQPPPPPPRHWSGLENYYEKLRKSAQEASLVANQFNSGDIYQQQQQQQVQEEDQIGQLANLMRNRWMSKSLITATGSPIVSRQPYQFPIYGTHERLREPIVASKRPLEINYAAQTPIELNPYELTGTTTTNWTSGSSFDYGWPSAFASSHSRPVSSHQQVEAMHQQHMMAQQRRQQQILELFGRELGLERLRLEAEEMACGPRNIIGLNGAKLSAASVKAGEFSEFPSHAALYQGPPDDKTNSNFLCGASWLHERFVLTLASCVVGKTPQQLKVRLGEWNLNRNQTATSLNPSPPKPMLTLDVDQLFIFPSYINGSRDHNLALVRLAKPLEFSHQLAYLTPACLPSSRAKLQALECRSPVRQTTASEYFDPEGEGETKLRRHAAMVERSVALVANDELECQQRTKQQYFNFLHPNLICASDFRKSQWRQQLNQTDSFGSGVYCSESGVLSLVSIVQPVVELNTSATTYGLLDLTFYRPWMRNITLSNAF